MRDLPPLFNSRHHRYHASLEQRPSCGNIHDAARNHDSAKVKALPKDYPDLVFSKNDYGSTPLHEEANYGHKDAELLLANKADFKLCHLKTSGACASLNRD